MAQAILVPLLACAGFALRGAASPSPALITEPVSVVQYEDAVVIYMHGFDLARTRYPSLQLDYRMVSQDGTVGVGRTLDLTEPWETPALTIRKGGTDYAGIVVSATSGAEVFFRRLYTLSGNLDVPANIPTAGQQATIELGQHAGSIPVILLPDLDGLDDALLSGAPDIVDVEPSTIQVWSNINYPSVSSSHTCALSRQTDSPADDSKRSLYVPLRSQFFDQSTGQPTVSRHYLCEVPLDPNWLVGSGDLVVNLGVSDIKVHWTDEEFDDDNILGVGVGGLGQTTGTMARDADGNIYFSRVPTQLVRFNIATAEFETPPVNMKTLMNDDRPTRDEIDGSGGDAKRGNWGTYRMIAHMNAASPARMIFTSVQNRLQPNGYFWAGLWTVPQDHWDDPVAFETEFRFLVGAWPNAQHTFWDTLPVLDGPIYRLRPPISYGNTAYMNSYPGGVGGPWRLDIAPDGTVEAFGTEATLSNYDDGYNKPRDAKPENANRLIDFSDYGVLTMTARDLHKALTGTVDNSLEERDIEVSYDAVGHMLQNPAEFAPILQNISGISLAPTYMATVPPGQDGQVLAASSTGYHLERYDLNTVVAGEVEKTHLILDSADTSLQLPLRAGVGPYAHSWLNLDGDDWLYAGGYIGLTRMKYAEDGVPLQRHVTSKFDAQLATVNLDAGRVGSIKRYRNLQPGLDGRMFFTGTNNASRGGTAFSGGLQAFHSTQLDTLWRLSFMSRSYHTSRLRNRVAREPDGSLVQEFGLLGEFFRAEYLNTLEEDEIPLGQVPKVFFYDYRSGGAMRDCYGFSLASLGGDVPADDIAFTNDRRYLLILQADRLLTFDPQTYRFIDGKRLTFGSGIRISRFRRPDHNFLRAPDDRLFLYAAASELSTTASFVEVQVSPAGEISLAPHLELQAASHQVLDQTFFCVHTFVPDLANDDGSYDLLLGRVIGEGGTDFPLIEDFIPPRQHELARTVNVLSTGIGGVQIAGTVSGVTPYTATCPDGQTLSLTATAPLGYSFVEWQDEDGNRACAGATLHMDMVVDRSVTAVYRLTPAATNLVVSEIHHLPAGPTGVEMAAGYSDRDQFEFVELMNVGTSDVDLREVNFIEVDGEGVAFDFSTSSFDSLEPGGRVLLVSDTGAFTERYGPGLLGQVAGEFTGELSDGQGELTLRNCEYLIRTFTYGDPFLAAKSPDPTGFSLILIDPMRQPTPDHGDPLNWRESVAVGGNPGSSDATSYSVWQAGHGSPQLDPAGDDDVDGRLNFVEYLQDTDPREADQAQEVVASIKEFEVDGETDRHLCFEFKSRANAEDVEFAFEQSEDLDVWIPLPTVFVRRQRQGDSQMDLLLFRVTEPVHEARRKLARLSMQLK